MAQDYAARRLRAMPVTEEQLGAYNYLDEAPYAPDTDAASVLPCDYFRVPISDQPFVVSPKVRVYDIGSSQYTFSDNRELGDGHELPEHQPRNDNACACIALIFGLYMEHRPLPRELDDLIHLCREVLSIGYAF